MGLPMWGLNFEWDFGFISIIIAYFIKVTVEWQGLAYKFKCSHGGIFFFLRLFLHHKELSHGGINTSTFRGYTIPR